MSDLSLQYIAFDIHHCLWCLNWLNCLTYHCSTLHLTFIIAFSALNWLNCLTYHCITLHLTFINASSAFNWLNCLTYHCSTLHLTFIIACVVILLIDCLITIAIHCNTLHFTALTFSIAFGLELLNCLPYHCRTLHVHLTFIITSKVDKIDGIVSIIIALHCIGHSALPMVYIYIFCWIVWLIIALHSNWHSSLPLVLLIDWIV